MNYISSQKLDLRLYTILILMQRSVCICIQCQDFSFWLVVCFNSTLEIIKYHLNRKGCPRGRSHRRTHEKFTGAKQPKGRCGRREIKRLLKLHRSLTCTLFSSIIIISVEFRQNKVRVVTAQSLGDGKGANVEQ